MSHNPSIAAVFATMNRAGTAVTCVSALAAQTRPPDMVIVADNDSSDDTVSRLQSLRDLPFRMIVHRMPENQGNAGGVREAMELAFSNGSEAVWILDDDSWPRPDALAELVDGDWDPRVVRHSMQLDPHTGRFTWPLWVSCPSVPRQWYLAETLAELPPGRRIPSRIMWTGALISREIREAVGAVNADLFIRGEDEEYPRRINQAGFTQIAYVTSILDHPGPKNLVRWRFSRWHFFFERGLVNWKLYYKIRNMVWLQRANSNTWHAVSMAMAYAAAATIIDGPARLPLVVRAIMDGWCGRLGKWSDHPVDPARENSR